MKFHRSATLALTATACLLLALAPTASATDGVVLINQATAIHPLPGCGGLTNVFRETGAIVICQPGSYRLSGNIDASGLSASAAILIVADSVTLDLNGFTVTAPQSDPVEGAPTAVVTINQGVTVENGSVISSNSGITLSDITETVRQVHVTLTGTTEGIGIEVAGGQIIECIVSTYVVNQSTGFWVVDGSIFDSQLWGTAVGVQAQDSVQMSRLFIHNTIVGVQASQEGNGFISASVLSGNQTDMIGVVSQGNNICSNSSPC